MKPAIIGSPLGSRPTETAHRQPPSSLLPPRGRRASYSNGEDSHVPICSNPKFRRNGQELMRILTTLPALRQARGSLSGSLGLVPARGALHAGKLSLVERARAECDHVPVSLMGKEAPERDDLERDLRVLEPLWRD